MSPEEVGARLNAIDERQQKALDLLNKLSSDAAPKKKDTWDKFQIISAFVSGVLLVVLGGIFTSVYKSRQDQVEKDQKAVQLRLEGIDSVSKFMPYLVDENNGGTNKRHAVRILQLVGDPSLAVQVANEFGEPETAREIAADSLTSSAVGTKVLKAYNLIQSPNNPNVGQGIAKVTADLSKELKTGHTIVFVASATIRSLVLTSVMRRSSHGARVNQISKLQIRRLVPAVLRFCSWRTTLPHTLRRISPPDRVPANAGIIKMPQQRLEDVREAPESGYSVHYFTPELNAIYCIRTWDGQHFATIKVTDISGDRIGFDWVYQPSASRRFE